MINEDGVRSLGSATISRRRLLGGLAGSAVVLAADRCFRVAREPRHRPLAVVRWLQDRQLGSSASDAVPKRPSPRWSTPSKKSGDTVTINTGPHNDFQNKINTYLQGSPDDAFTWFAGYRMRYYAAKGLVAPIDDVWEGRPETSPTASPRPPPATTARSTSCRTTTTRGGSSTARASGRPRATRCRPRSTTSKRCAQKMKRRPDPRSRSPTRTAGRRWAPSTT